jgi:formylglycine-generating enzyme required for sulfatase activity
MGKVTSATASAANDLVPPLQKVKQDASDHDSSKLDQSKWPVKPWPEGMVWIPGGEFQMGGVGPEARKDEFPVHPVKVDGFWMNTTVITNEEFRKFVKATGYGLYNMIGNVWQWCSDWFHSDYSQPWPKTPLLRLIPKVLVGPPRTSP